MNPNVDLSQLAVAARPPGRRAGPPPAAPADAVRAAGGLLLAASPAAGGLRGAGEPAAAAAGDGHPVLTTRAGGAARRGTPLFRAAGWVEPRPTPVVVTGPGRGRRRAAPRRRGPGGQGGRARGPAGRRRRPAGPGGGRGRGPAARARPGLRPGRRWPPPARGWPSRSTCEAALADAEAVLAERSTSAIACPSSSRPAEARRRLAAGWSCRQDRRGRGVPAAVRPAARSELDAARPAVEELQGRQACPRAGDRRPDGEAGRPAQKLEPKIDEIRQLAEAEAAVQVAEARLRQAKIGQDRRGCGWSG